jgi:hypothetical protein
MTVILIVCLYLTYKNLMQKLKIIWHVSIVVFSFKSPFSASFPLNNVTVSLHTYHLRFIPEGVAEVSQIFL